jgi:hypothetical protein
MSEKVLPYDRVIAPQEKYWDCGPASTQVVLNSRGIIESEDSLIRDIGTTTRGTDDVSWVEHSMDRHGFDYSSDYITNWPPSNEQKELLWRRIVASVDFGFGVVINIDVPPTNYPRGVLGSASPAYGGGEIFHYIAAMGYHDGPDIRAVWIADPGFKPFGYWIALDQLVTCIVPKGYCYLTNPVAVQRDDSVEAVMADNQTKLNVVYDKMAAYPDAPEVGGKWPSRARCATSKTAGVDDTVGMILYTDANVYDLLIAWSAVTVNDPYSVKVIRDGAAGKLPANDPDSLAWFKAVAAKLPK